MIWLDIECKREWKNAKRREMMVFASSDIEWNKCSSVIFAIDDE